MAEVGVRDASDRRPVFGGTSKFQTDPPWRDCALFYEYFHGDSGAGVGASHQTGWTGVVVRLRQFYGAVDPRVYLEGGRKALFRESAGAALTH